VERNDEVNNLEGAPTLADSNSEELRDPTRRKFSRGALMGGAVMLSLGSRAAWGGGGTVVDCMSVMTLNSFNPSTGMFLSSPAGNHKVEHNENLAREIHRIGGAPDYLGRDGRYRTCEDLSNSDNICLVRGRCPD